MVKQRIVISLEERMKRYAQSQAASPEAAARNVKRIGMVSPLGLMTEEDYGLFMDEVGGFAMLLEDEELDHYQGFCRLFKMIGENTNLPMDKLDDYTCMLFFTEHFTNFLILMALIFLANARNPKRQKKERFRIYPFLRMSLGEYLDAFIDLSFLEDGTLDEAHVKKMKEIKEYILKNYDKDKPLADTIQAILENYIDGYEDFEYLEYVIRSKQTLGEYLVRGDEIYDELKERLEEEEDEYEIWHLEDLLLEQEEIMQNPYDFFENYACSYSNDYLERLRGECFESARLAKDLFVKEQDYSCEFYQRKLDKIDIPDFHVDLDKVLNEKNLTEALKKINRSATEILLLLGMVYINLDKYHFVKHIEEEAVQDGQ